ncbi:MAG: hypothetical protein SOW25_00625 [Helicobacter sp.]|nr:hypothetical protein [Helicobacteraceae bacterium]MDY3112816.1 hypothetical protein [Helicobacter sp.]
MPRLAKASLAMTEWNLKVMDVMTMWRILGLYKALDCFASQ